MTPEQGGGRKEGIGFHSFQFTGLLREDFECTTWLHETVKKKKKSSSKEEEEELSSSEEQGACDGPVINWNRFLVYL